MDIATIKEKIEKDRTLKRDVDYYLNVALVLAKTYYNYFTLELINDFFNNINSISTKNATKLPLDKFVFKESYINYLEYSELITLKGKTFLIKFNLKGQVQEFYINNISVISNNIDILDALQILTEKNLSINYEKIYNYFHELYIISLIYNYAYETLKNKAKSETDYIRAGMFKNAYYNIIDLINQNWLKNLMNLNAELSVSNKKT